MATKPSVKTTKPQRSIESKTVFQQGKLHPSISILIPVNRKYPQFRLAEKRLKALVKEAEAILKDELSEEMAKSAINKLRATALSVDFTHLSESLAIFVSSEIQKVIHLSIPVEEKLIVGRTFELRDLFFAAKMNFHYLVLTISENKVRVFLGYGNHLQEEYNDQMPFGNRDVQGEGHSRVQTFGALSSSKNVSDDQSRIQVLQEKYLRDVDNELSLILKQRNIPVIICGVQKGIAGFNAITKNKNLIIGTVEGNFDYLNEVETFKKIEPVLMENQRKEEKKNLALLDEAISKKTFASGIRDVWRAVLEKRGRLLLVEKGYRIAGKPGKDKYTLITNDIDLTNTKNIKDVVDDIIEYVFEYRGDVAFVENGALSEHGGIALITYYNVHETLNKNAL